MFCICEYGYLFSPFVSLFSLRCLFFIKLIEFWHYGLLLIILLRFVIAGNRLWPESRRKLSQTWSGKQCLSSTGCTPDAGECLRPSPEADCSAPAETAGRLARGHRPRRRQAEARFDDPRKNARHEEAFWRESRLRKAARGSSDWVLPGCPTPVGPPLEVRFFFFGDFVGQETNSMKVTCRWWVDDQPRECTANIFFEKLFLLIFTFHFSALF